MSPERVYHHRGTLADCLLALIAQSGTIGQSFLSIVSNDHSNYYGLVDDTFLNSAHDHPDDHHMRLILRINDAELKCIHDVLEQLQGDLFD